MNILYDEKLSRVDTYTYEINAGGEDNIIVSNDGCRNVSITFIDGKFNEAKHNISREFIGTPSYYAVMGGIYKKIKELEEKQK